MNSENKLLIGKVPNLQAGEGYLYQYFNFLTDEITEEDEAGNILSSRPVNLIQKGLKTEFGSVVVSHGGKVYFDNNNIAKRSTVNRYLLQKSLFGKFPKIKTPKVEAPELPKIDTDSTKTPKAVETPTIPKVEVPKTPEPPKQLKYQKGQERPGHKYIRRLPDPKNPGKYIYLYQEDIDAENKRGGEYKTFDESGQAVKYPKYDKKYYEGNYSKKADWKPAKEKLLNKVMNTLDRTGKNYEYSLGDDRKIVAAHADYQAEGRLTYYDSKTDASIPTAEERIRELEDLGDENGKNGYIPITENEIFIQPIWDGEQGKHKGLIVYDRQAEKYKFLEGDINDAGWDDRESSPASRWLESAWKYQRSNKKNDELKAEQPTSPEATSPEATAQTEAETATETTPEALPQPQSYEIGNEYSINGFTGKLTAKEGKIGILKDSSGNLRMMKLEEFTIEPKEPTAEAPTEITPEFRNYKEYRSWLDRKDRAKQNAQLASRMQAGGVGIGKRRRKDMLTPEEIEAEQKAQQEKEQLRQASLDKNRAIFESEPYQTGRKEIEDKGFKINGNNFIATKEVNARNFKFTLKAEFNPEANEWRRSMYDAPYKTVEIDGTTHTIDDLNEHGVYYTEIEIPEVDLFGGEEQAEPREVSKFISYDELEEKNGKRIFEKTAQSKGLVSKFDAEDVFFPDNEKEKGSWEVIELDDLILSHNQDGSPNTQYSNKKAQARDRSDERTQAQISEFATNMQFDLFKPNTSVWSHDGAPVVDQDYETISGNGRGMGIQRHYEEHGDAYKQGLIKNAERLGFNPEDIQAMNQPVVVRRLKVDKDRAIKLGALGNKDQKVAQSETEKAIAYSRLMTPKAARSVGGIFERATRELRQRHIDSGGNADEFNVTMNNYLDNYGYDVFRTLQDNGIISNNETSLFYDIDKDIITPDQKRFTKNILTQYALGEEANKNWDEAYESTKDGIQQGLGALLTLKDTEHDITPELAQVIAMQGSMRRINQKRQDEGKPVLKPQDYLAEQSSSMFDGNEQSEEAKKIFLAVHNQSAKEVRNLISKYNTATEGDIFSGSKPKAELIAEVFGNETKKSLFTRIMKAIRDNV